MPGLENYFLTLAAAVDESFYSFSNGHGMHYIGQHDSVRPLHMLADPRFRVQWGGPRVHKLWLLLLLCGGTEVNPGPTSSLLLGSINTNVANRKGALLSDLIVEHHFILLGCVGVSEMKISQDTPNVVKFDIALTGYGALHLYCSQDSRTCEGGLAIVYARSLSVRPCKTTTQPTSFQLQMINHKARSHDIIIVNIYRLPLGSEPTFLTCPILNVGHRISSLTRPMRWHAGWWFWLHWHQTWIAVWCPWVQTTCQFADQYTTWLENRNGKYAGHTRDVQLIHDNFGCSCRYFAPSIRSCLPDQVEWIVLNGFTGSSCCKAPPMRIRALLEKDEKIREQKGIQDGMLISKHYLFTKQISPPKWIINATGNAHHVWFKVKDLLQSSPPGDAKSKEEWESYRNSTASFFIKEVLDIRNRIAIVLCQAFPDPMTPDTPNVGAILDDLAMMTLDKVKAILVSMSGKSSPPVFLPTSVLKRASDTFLHIAWLANLLFAHGTFLAKFEIASVTTLLKKTALD